MIYNKYVELGRVVFISKGKNEGKLAVIVDIIDGNKVLLDGPSTGVNRGVRNLKDLNLTKFRLSVSQGLRTKKVQKVFDDAKIADSWAKTAWAQKIERRTLRKGLNDFERFKVSRVKQLRNRLVRREVAKLRKTAKKQ